MSLLDPRSIHLEGVPDLDYEDLILHPVFVCNASQEFMERQGARFHEQGVLGKKNNS